MMESLSETLFQLVNIKTLTASQNSLDFKELEHLHLQIIVKLCVDTVSVFSAMYCKSALNCNECALVLLILHCTCRSYNINEIICHLSVPKERTVS